ncbi:MAG: hypothetical protein H7Z12_00245 [Rhodospirillaceae bacterium]|nr:hypothetical protein [Rhodospirillales bacterium]
MSMWWKRITGTVIMSMVLAACAAPPPPAAPVASLDRVLKLNMPRSPNEPVVYRYAGENFTDPDRLLDKVWADSNRELSGVIPAAVPVGGSIRMLLPTFEAMPISRGGRWSDTIFFVELYARVLDDEKVEAVRRTRMFSAITVDYTDTPGKGHGNADFTLWKEGPGWWMRHRDGDAFLITQSQPGLATWLKGLRTAAFLSRDGRGEQPAR